MLRRFSLKSPALLPYKPLNFKFSNRILDDYISNIYKDEDKNIERKNLDDFVKKFSKLHAFSEKEKKQSEKLSNKFLNFSINSRNPLKDILKNHIAKSKYGFNEDQLTLTFEYLSRTYKSFGKGHRHYADFDVK